MGESYPWYGKDGMVWYGIDPSYYVPHVCSFTSFPIPLTYPYQYPIYPPYTIIADLIGAPENVENALLEAYKDSKIDFEFERLKNTLDKDGNEKISYNEWNQVVGSLYPAVKLKDSGELTTQEYLELIHLAILFEFNFHDKNQDGILTEFWVFFNDADTNRDGIVSAKEFAVERLQKTTQWVEFHNKKPQNTNLQSINPGEGGVWSQWHLQGFEGLQGLKVPISGGSTGIGLGSMQLLERIRLQKIRITLRNGGM